MCLAATVGRVPCHRTDIIAAGILEALAEDAATCSILPLGFGGKAVVFTRHCIQAVKKFHAIHPRNPLDGQLQVSCKVAGITTHNGLPQRLSHLGLADVVVGEREIVGRGFVAIGITALLGCSTQFGDTALNINHIEVHTIHMARSFGNRLVNDDGDIRLVTGQVILDNDTGRTHLEALEHQLLAAGVASHDLGIAIIDRIAAIAVQDGDIALLAHLEIDNLVGEHEPARVGGIHGQAETCCIAS